MVFEKRVILKNGKECILRNAEVSDAKDYLEYFVKAHSETDFLTTYPDESPKEIEEIKKRLEDAKNSSTNLELCAFVNGKLVGSADHSQIRNRDKMKHRAEFGISIVKEYWGMGIGDALTKWSIESARDAGFLQLELEVVSENRNAIQLYKKHGFTEFGRNPKAFLTRDGRWQELIMMRLEL